MSEYIVVSTFGQTRHIEMNRPERKNAITVAMYSTMADAINEAAANQEIRSVLISGAGGSFSSGNDLQDFMSNPPRDPKASPVALFMEALLMCPKPVVAAVDGVAVGIGTTMLLHCDLVYASSASKFKMPFASLGLCPEFGSSYLLPRMMGHQQAADLLMFGEAFAPEKAQACGFVNEVLSSEELMARAMSRCEDLNALPASSLRATKQLMRGGLQEEIISAMEKEKALFDLGLKSAEFSEAGTAFFEGRKPDFSKFN